MKKAFLALVAVAFAIAMQPEAVQAATSLSPGFQAPSSVTQVAAKKAKKHKMSKKKGKKHVAKKKGKKYAKKRRHKRAPKKS